MESRINDPANRRKTSKQSKVVVAKRNTSVSKDFENRLKEIETELKNFSQDFEREKTKLLGSLKQMKSERIKRKDGVGFLESVKLADTRKNTPKDGHEGDEVDTAGVSHPTNLSQNVYLSLPKIIVTRTGDDAKIREPVETFQEIAAPRARRRRSSLFESLKASLRVPDDPNIIDQLKVRNVPYPQLLQRNSVKWDINKVEALEELKQKALENHATRMSRRRSSFVAGTESGQKNSNRLIVVFNDENEKASGSGVGEKKGTDDVSTREAVFSENLNMPRRRVTIAGTSPSEYFLQAAEAVTGENSNRKRRISLDFHPRGSEKLNDVQRTPGGERAGVNRVGDINGDDAPNSCQAGLSVPSESSESCAEVTEGNRDELQETPENLRIQRSSGTSRNVRPCDYVLLRHEFPLWKPRPTYKPPKKPTLRSRSLESISVHIRRHNGTDTASLTKDGVSSNAVSRLQENIDTQHPGRLVYHHTVPEFGRKSCIVTQSDGVIRREFPHSAVADKDGGHKHAHDDQHLPPILLHHRPGSQIRPRGCTNKRVTFVVP